MANSEKMLNFARYFWTLHSSFYKTCKCLKNSSQRQ